MYLPDIVQCTPRWQHQKAAIMTTYTTITAIMATIKKFTNEVSITVGFSQRVTSARARVALMWSSPQDKPWWTPGWGWLEARSPFVGGGRAAT